MTIIAGSQETISPGQSGSWFTATDYQFMADVDNQASVYLEVRRSAASGGDPAKVLFTMQRWNDSKPIISGPCRVPVSSIPGSQYRFVNTSATFSAQVAADA